MNDKIKILIIGFGSIGQRHYHNLQLLKYTNVTVYDVDPQVIKDKKVRYISNLAQSSLEYFEVALICSPTSTHIPIALKCARAGCNLFIEKPLTNTENLCQIFRDNDNIYEAAIAMEKRWKVPLQIPMAIMYQESHFKEDARPGKDYLLGFIPWGYKSSAYGYAQGYS